MSNVRAELKKKKSKFWWMEEDDHFKDKPAIDYVPGVSGFITFFNFLIKELIYINFQFFFLYYRYYRFKF